jgi:PleD family two-component response regulator
VSIGLALLDEGPGLTACLGQADRRLYIAKQGGRNRVCSSG